MGWDELDRRSIWEAAAAAAAAATACMRFARRTKRTNAGIDGWMDGWMDVAMWLLLLVHGTCNTYEPVVVRS